MRKEVQRITDERKWEEERRRTQENKFNTEDLDRLSVEKLEGNRFQELLCSTIAAPVISLS